MAVCLGLGMTHEAAAERLGVARQTLYNHIAKNPRFFDRAIAEVQAIRTQIVAPAVKKEVEKAEDRIKGLFDGAFRITEKLLSKAEQLGDEITLEQAMAIHKNLTQWAAKFAASEAPKRLEVNGSVQHEHKLVPTRIFEVLEGVLREQKALPEAEVIEADVISQ